MLRAEYNELMCQLRNSLPKKLNDLRPANPLLICPPKSYEISDVKIMVFGQETNDWGEFDDPGGIEHLLDTYNEFFNSGACFSYGGHFWNGVSRLKHYIENKVAGKNNSISLIWNNIVKIGIAGEKGLPSEEIVEWQSPAFDVIKREMDTCKPNIVIFFTGPNYDKFIEKAFNDAKFEAIKRRDQRKLAKIKSQYLPKNSFRTYHPNYLWRIGFNEYMEELVNEINS